MRALKLGIVGGSLVLVSLAASSAGAASTVFTDSATFVGANTGLDTFGFTTLDNGSPVVAAGQFEHFYGFTGLTLHQVLFSGSDSYLYARAVSPNNTILYGDPEGPFPGITNPNSPLAHYIQTTLPQGGSTAVGVNYSSFYSGTLTIQLTVSHVSGLTESIPLSGAQVTGFVGLASTDPIATVHYSIFSSLNTSFGYDVLVFSAFSYRPPLQVLVNSLTTIINGLNLSPQLTTQLLGFVQKIPTSIASLTTAQKAAAITNLNGFISTVQTLVTFNVVPGPQGVQLIQLANLAIALLS